MEDANGKSLKPYPVFSMMSVPNNEDCNNSHDLLAGGGDRFVTLGHRLRPANTNHRYVPLTSNCNRAKNNGN